MVCVHMNCLDMNVFHSMHAYTTKMVGMHLIYAVPHKYERKEHTKRIGDDNNNKRAAQQFTQNAEQIKETIHVE